MDDPSMDEFAQTRGADDLFDDEIIPVTAEEQQVQTEVIPEPEPKPAPEPEPVKPVAQPEETPVPEKTASPRGEASQRGRGGDRGRGRGRGKGKTGGRGGGGGLSESRWAEPKRAAGPPQSKGKNSTPTTEPEAAPEEPAAKPNKTEEAEKPQPAQDEEEKGDAAGANGADAVRTPAVRGDRSATGGVRKPKLTDEELSKRIASAKENAAKKAAAHARAEADQASFMEREQAAAQKRREELAHRKAMENEREQNRQRKLKAQTGREWDSEKREEDYSPRGGGSQFRRGMHGGVSGYTRKDFDEGHAEESPSRGSPGRGRGRGGRGGRGRGARGDRSVSRGPSEKTDEKPAVNSDADFPSLPPGKPPLKTTETAPATAKVSSTMESLDSTFSPISGDWADQLDDE